MTFRQSVVTCFRKYADFKGRASRSEFWWFSLFFSLVFWPAFGVAGYFFSQGRSAAGVGVLLGVWLVLGLPASAVTVRRHHDTGRSLWTFRPSVEFEPGDPGWNQYGPPPGEPVPAARASAPSASGAPRRTTSQHGAPSTPAAFIPCPGCGRLINQEVGRCPYCHVPLGPNS
jgi:hypothetical protein